MLIPISTPDNQRLIASKSSVTTCGELKERCASLASLLDSGRLERLMVCSDNPLDILRAIEAAQRCNADLWIAHTSLSLASRQEIIQRYGIQLLVGKEDQILAASDSSAHLKADRRIHLMTSGTTGQPKLVVHTLDSLKSRVAGPASISANREGRWLLTYQASAFAGLQVTLTALFTGGLLVIPEDRSPMGFWDASCFHEVTHISGTPTFWRSFLLVASADALKLRQITVGGEAVDQITLDRLRQSFPQAHITHIYASTEAGVVFAVHDALAGFPASWLGQANQGTQLRIVDGELQVNTKNAMKGYRDQSLAALPEDGWLATNDLVGISDSRVTFLGRRDDLLNIGGAKVHPQLVETFLLSLAGVVEVRVSGEPNPITGFLVKAEVVLDKNEDANEARRRILAECFKGLAPYQVPRILKIVDAIPLSASGKKAKWTDSSM